VHRQVYRLSIYYRDNAHAARMGRGVEILGEDLLSYMASVPLVVLIAAVPADEQLLECRTAGERDCVGDQLRALRDTIFREVDGACYILVTAALQLSIAAVIVVAVPGAGQAILEHRDTRIRSVVGAVILTVAP
jgi:hypothetical protein